MRKSWGKNLRKSGIKMVTFQSELDWRNSSAEGGGRNNMNACLRISEQSGFVQKEPVSTHVRQF